MFFSKRIVFISHSSVNTEIAKQLSGLLQKIGIPSEKIFCSSVLGQGVNNGEKLNDRIYRSIKKAKVIIYLLSDAFISSNYCMEELGIGWYFTFDKRKTCCYLRLNDIEMHELNGFVNSKIDKFSVVNVPNDIILFIENICEAMSVNIPRATVISNYAETFISAISIECQNAIDKKIKQKEIQRQREDEVLSLNEKIKRCEEVIESYKRRIELKEAESKKESLMNELRHIESLFHVLGSSIVISRDIILTEKQFFFNMVNRYEELHSLLVLEPDDGSMEKLLSQSYLACKNYEKSYIHFLNAVKLNDAMTRFEIEFFIQAYPYSIREIIQIYEKRYDDLPEGLNKDFIKNSLIYMKEVERMRNDSIINTASNE